MALLTDRNVTFARELDRQWEMEQAAEKRRSEEFEYHRDMRHQATTKAGRMHHEEKMRNAHRS